MYFYHFFYQKLVRRGTQSAFMSETDFIAEEMP